MYVCLTTDRPDIVHVLWKEQTKQVFLIELIRTVCFEESFVDGSLRKTNRYNNLTTQLIIRRHNGGIDLEHIHSRINNNMMAG